ncbi:hypothetical protein JXA05_01815 [Candidatus Peregrinibacteria bacterium]|nr:hypothetical protein [Candidatus Peregrinibacteria bacterium]
MENPAEKDPRAPLLSWSAPEFIPAPRGKTWFLAAGVIVVSLIAYAIFTGSAVMAIVFILISGLFYMTHNKPPRIVETKITPLGVFYDRQFHAYNTINSFWVVYHPPYVRALYLRISGRGGQRVIKIELLDQDPVEVRKMLAREIPEAEGAGEPMMDLLIRALRLQ